MFSGIIQAQGTIKTVKKTGQQLAITMTKPHRWQIATGESITVDGICTTVISVDSDVSFFYMPETVRRTTVGNWVKGTRVNLECSLRLNDMVGGHLVTGHIDATGRVKSIKKDGQAKIMMVDYPSAFSSFLVEKGSIAVNGISLTIIDAGKTSFRVGLIPYTLSVTNLGRVKPGDWLNLEFDMIAKYVKRMLNKPS